MEELEAPRDSTPLLSETDTPPDLLHGPNARNHRLRRWIGRIVGLCAISAASGIGGSMLIPAHTKIGPHDAEITLTADSQITYDLGPLGTLSKPTGTLGAHISIKGVPSEGVPANLEFTNYSDNLFEQYSNLFNDPEKDAAATQDALLEHMRNLALYGGAASIGIFLLLGKKSRGEIIERFKPSGLGGKIMLSSALGLGMLGAGLYASSATSAVQENVAIGPGYDNTPLEDFRVSGVALQLLMNKLGPVAMDKYASDQKFYRTLLNNFEAEAKNNHLLKGNSDSITLLDLTDLHCNIDMAKLIGEVAEASNVNLVTDAGDTTMSGSSFEEICVSSLVYHLQDRPIITAGGNHDSDLTEEQQRKYGIKVLDGKPLNVAGLRILGDDDPRRSSAGQPIHQEKAETVEQMGVRLADMACNDSQDVDIIIVHAPESALATLQQDCAKIALTGHSHQEELAYVDTVNGTSLPLYTGASAGGAAQNSVTLGPLQNPAKIAIIQINKKSHIPERQQTITFLTDGNVDLGQITEFQAYSTVDNKGE